VYSEGRLQKSHVCAMSLRAEDQSENESRLTLPAQDDYQRGCDIAFLTRCVSVFKYERALGGRVTRACRHMYA
jgi:hypothetical protein